MAISTVDRAPTAENRANCFQSIRLDLDLRLTRRLADQSAPQYGQVFAVTGISAPQ